MNMKTSLFVIFVKAIIYFLLYDLHDCTFNKCHMRYCSVEVQNTKKMNTLELKERKFEKEVRAIV